MKKAPNLFTRSIPVAIGYIFMGSSFGILWAKEGGEIWESAFLGLFAFAGSAQILCVKFLGEQIDYFALFMAMFLLNLRHLFYGPVVLREFLSLTALKRFYMTWSLTDENFGLLQLWRSEDSRPNIENKEKFNIHRTWRLFLLNHCYWISGCALGAYLASGGGLNIRGLEFTLIAIFIILGVENTKNLGKLEGLSRRRNRHLRLKNSGKKA